MKFFQLGGRENKCALFCNGKIYPVSIFFPPLGTTWVEAAEGETKVTSVVVRRIGTGSIEVEAVGVVRRVRGT